MLEPASALGSEVEIVEIEYAGFLEVMLAAAESPGVYQDADGVAGALDVNAFQMEERLPPRSPAL